MRRILLTGAGGFVGRHVLPQLLAGGDEIHAVGRQAVAQGDGRVHRHAVDLLDSVAARRLVREVAPTHWLHLAWYAEHGRFWSAPVNLRWVASTLDMLEAFADAGGRRVVMAGSCAEYDWQVAGQCCAGITPERPATLYGAAKQALSGVLGPFSRAAAISAAWGRIYFPYGPGESGERLVPYVVRSLLAGRVAECSAGMQQRDFIHVADLAEAFTVLLDSDFEGALDIGTGQAVAVRDVALAIGAAIGRPDLVQLGARPMPAGDPPLLVADTSALRTLGWAPRFDLPAGIADTIDWWRHHTAEATV